MAQWSGSCLLAGGSNCAGSNLHVDICFFSFTFFLNHIFSFLLVSLYSASLLTLFSYARFFCNIVFLVLDLFEGWQVLLCVIVLHLGVSKYVFSQVLRVFLFSSFGFQELSFSEFKSTTYQIEGRNN